jgi:hypothetical protein
MKNFLNQQTLVITASLAFLLLGTTGTAAFASTSASSANSASAIPRGAVVTHGFVALGPSTVTPAKTVKSVWAGYGQVEKGTHAKIYGGVDGWIVPAAKCSAASANPQYTFLLSWFDGYTSSSESAFAGVELSCAVGQHGPATVTIVDPVSGYGGASAGDQITAYVADYSGSGVGSNCSGTCVVMYIVDWTTGGYIEDTLAESSIAHTSYVGVVDIGISTACSGASNICPQVQYKTMKDGSLYDTAQSVVCADNPDGTTPPYPCVQYGSTLKSNFYYYAIGATVAGATDYKFVMDSGDNGVIGAPYYAATGALQSDLASHTIKFKQA